MRGDLSADGLDTIFDGLARAGATGALHLESPHGQAKVFFRDGDVYHATSPAPRAQLGARLVGAGFIDDEDLDRALAAQDQGPERTKLGAILVDQGMVRRDVIRVFVQEQILDAVFDLARWDEGDYEFFGGDAVAEDLPVQIPTGPLLMEVRRRLAEWGDIREVIPSLDAVPDFVRGGSTAQAALEPDEFTLLTSVDGRRSVRELAHDLGYSQFDAARLIYGLSLLGVIAVPNGDGPVEHGHRPEERTGSSDEGVTEAATDGPEDGPDDIDIGRALEEALFGGGFEEPDGAPEPPEHATQEAARPQVEQPDAEPAAPADVPAEHAGGSDDLEPEVWSASIDIDEEAVGSGAPPDEPTEPTEDPQEAPPVAREDPHGASPVSREDAGEPAGEDALEEDAHEELLALMDELQGASDDVELRSAPDDVEDQRPPQPAEPPAEPAAPEPAAPGSAARDPEPADAPTSGSPDERQEERTERGDVSELLRELSRLAGDGPEPVAPSPKGDDTQPDEASRQEPPPSSQEDEPEPPPRGSDHEDDDKGDDKRSTFRRLFGSR